MAKLLRGVIIKIVSIGKSAAKLLLIVIFIYLFASGPIIGWDLFKWRHEQPDMANFLYCYPFAQNFYCEPGYDFFTNFIFAWGYPWAKLFEIIHYLTGLK